MDNAFIESHNDRLRDECLNVHRFTQMAEAQGIIEAWRLDDSQCHPHSSLGHLTLKEVLDNVRLNRSTKKSSTLVKNRLRTGPTSTLGSSPFGAIALMGKLTITSH